MAGTEQSTNTRIEIHLTLAETAAALGVGVATVRRRIGRRLLRAQRSGRCWIIAPSEVARHAADPTAVAPVPAAAATARLSTGGVPVATVDLALCRDAVLCLWPGAVRPDGRLSAAVAGRIAAQAGTTTASVQEFFGGADKSLAVAGRIIGALGLHVRDMAAPLKS